MVKQRQALSIADIMEDAYGWYGHQRNTGCFHQISTEFGTQLDLLQDPSCRPDSTTQNLMWAHVGTASQSVSPMSPYKL